MEPTILLLEKSRERSQYVPSKRLPKENSFSDYQSTVINAVASGERKMRNLPFRVSK